MPRANCAHAPHGRPHHGAANWAVRPDAVATSPSAAGVPAGPSRPGRLGPGPALAAIRETGRRYCEPPELMGAASQSAAAPPGNGQKEEETQKKEDAM